MSARERVHIVDFAIRGLAAMKEVAIPGGYAHVVVGAVVHGNVPLSVGKIRVAKFEDPAAFRNWIAHPDHARAQVLRFIIHGAVALGHGTSAERHGESCYDHDPACRSLYGTGQPQPGWMCRPKL
jgi:hypothetical protein